MKKILTLGFIVLGFAFINTLSAQCIKGNCYEGAGTFVFENGDKYEGQWQAGKMHGKGKYEFVNGDRYRGTYALGQRSGMGQYTWAKGGKYVGEWKLDKREGYGKFTWPDSAQYFGYWKEDQIINMDVSTTTDSQAKPIAGN